MWLYCDVCDSEFHQSSNYITSVGTVDDLGVHIRYYCLCGNKEPLVDMAEINRPTPAMRKEAENLKTLERNLLRELEKVRIRLKELGFD